MILLNVVDLVKHFGPEPVLDGVSFEIRPKERVGLVGPNGTGKTTLLKILAGQETADSGTVELHSSAKIAYLEQQPQFSLDRTLWDEARSALDPLIALSREAERIAHDLAAASDSAERARLGKQFDRLQHELHSRDAYNLDHKIARILGGLGFSSETYTQPILQLSGGQQNRLMLAKLLLAEPDLMLLDEPSNHLDIEATQWLEDFLRASDQAMIVVSHDRYFLDRVTERTLEIYNGTTDSYPGNFSAYWRQKAERLESQRRTYDKQQIEIAKTEDFIRKNFYGQKATQAKDREKKLARIDRVDRPREIAAPSMGFPPVKRAGDIVLRAETLSKSFDRPLFANLSFQIERGQRWGIVGPNGTGKTTLLKCLIGEIEPTTGRSQIGSNVKLAYFDQLLSGLDDDASVVDAVRPPGKEFTEPERRDLLARFGLTGAIVFQKVKSLSGGERNRAALARLSGVDANFLILDEPTNHLDLWARDSLERSLLAFEGTVLFVSHDRYFLNRVADHLLIVEPTRFRVLEGNYDTYLHFVAAGLAADHTAARMQSDGRSLITNSERPGLRRSGIDETTDDGSNGVKPVDISVKRKRRRFPYRKATDIEREIAQREARIEELNAMLVDPQVLRNGDRVREFKAELSTQQVTLSALYEHWEEAVEMNG